MPNPTTHAEGLRYWSEVTPDRVALQDDAQSVTFAELHERVSRLGRVTRRSVAESGSPSFLPVMVDRSVDSCIALLACFHSRIPFFPVDSGASRERIGDLVERAGSPTRFLAGPQFDDANAPQGSLRVVTDLSAEMAADDAVEVDPRGAGLVIFTSGTTGVAKGVVLDWGALDERWRAWDAEPSEGPSHWRAPLFAPLDSSFGLTILGQVASGCSTLVIDPTRYRPIDLLRRLAEFGPSSMALPPQLGRVLAQLPDKEGLSLPTVKRLQTGTEGFRFESLAGLQAILPASVEVMFAFGATEGFRILVHRFTLGTAPRTGPVPVGLPFNADDVRFRPAPGMDAGIVEVLAGGPIATGYLDDAEQTARRFLTDPDGRRWWCSGDLVTLTDEGLYQHVGRSDDVVKVRGKIASPAEVVTALLRIPGIRHAVVIPHEQDSNVRLIAHVDVEQGAVLTLDDVRAALRRELPSHLVPSAVLRHACLPSTDRGKLDRRALMDGPFEPWD